MEIIKSTLCFVVLVKCVQISGGTWTAEGRIGLRYYLDGPTLYIEEPMEVGDRIFTNEHYNKSLPLLILIHGMDATVDCEFVEGSVKALFFREINKQYNIIALNLPELMAKQSVLDKYLYTTALNSKIAGNSIGNFLNKIIQLQYISPDQIHVIGYSMGAQVAGYLARKIKNAHGQIYFILGLDPAGIGFTPSTIASWYTGLVHVSVADAKYVHFMHCNSVGWGTLYHNATANFVFNGGNFQPGCATSSNLGCSHNRVPFYFIESILYPKGFLTQRCESWRQFLSCQCSSEDKRYLTFPPDLSASGSYYLRTREETAFGRGEDGVKCVEKTTSAIELLEENYADKTKLKRHKGYMKNVHKNMYHMDDTTIYHHRKRQDYEKMSQREAMSNREDQAEKHSSESQEASTRIRQNGISLEVLENMHNNIIKK